MSDPKKPNLDNECDAHKYTCEMLEHIVSSQNRIELVQVEQASDIKHHISRTDDLQKIVGDMSKSLGSLEATRNRIIGALQLLAGAGAIVSLVKLLSLLL